MRKLQSYSPEVNSAKALGAKYYQLPSRLTFIKALYRVNCNIRKHLSRRANVHTERHKFLSKTQGTEETIAQYIAELQKISRTSDWTCQNEICKTPISLIIQAQSIRGLWDVEIREQILQQGDDINFEKAIEIALSVEAAKKQNKIYSNSLADIHKISNNMKKSAFVTSSGGKSKFKRDERFQKNEQSYRGKIKSFKDLD